MLPRVRRARPRRRRGFPLLGAFLVAVGMMAAAALVQVARKPPVPLPKLPPVPAPRSRRAPTLEEPSRIRLAQLHVAPSRGRAAAADGDPPSWSARVIGDELVHAAYEVKAALDELGPPARRDTSTPGLRDTCSR